MKINKLFTAGLLSLAGAGAVSGLEAARPNIILMVADDLGYGDTGCYGSQKIPTPNIDRLAAQGMRFTDAHASGAVCTPSRYGMLTGRYYSRYRRNWVGECLINNRPTIASVLRQNGYATSYFGKWHLGWGVHDDREQRAAFDWNKELPTGVLECGFDYYFGTPFSHNEAPFVFVQNRWVVGLEADDPLVIPPKSVDRGLWGFGNSIGAKKAHAMRPQDRIDLMVTKQAQDWIESNREKPFFMNLAFVAPHVPIAPAKEFRGKTGAGLYGDFVHQMDWCVGQISQTLEACGLADNTIIIFTSDNGGVLDTEVLASGHHSNGVLLGQKTDGWEGGHRVPFIVRWPGKVPAGSVTDRLISLTDLPATILEAVGVQAPSGAAEDSLSQLSVWMNPSALAVRPELLILGVGGLVLRSDEWLYIPRQGSSGKTTAEKDAWLGIKAQGHTHSDYDETDQIKAGAPETQLYNLHADISQTTNVVRAYPEKAAVLAKRCAELIRDAQDNNKNKE